MRKYPHTNQWHISKLNKHRNSHIIPNYHEAWRTHHTGEVVDVTWTQLHGLENTAHRRNGRCNMDSYMALRTQHIGEMVGVTWTVTWP